MKNIWSKLVAIVVLLAVLALPACNKAATSTTQTASVDRVIKIGLSLPLSGNYAAWGTPYLRAMELLVDKVNGAGGISIQGAKYTVKIIAYDDKFTAAEGQLVAQRLVSQDKVSIIGFNASPPRMAARDMVQQAGILSWGTAYTNTEPSPAYPLAFAMAIKYAEVSSPAYAWLAKAYPKVKNVAVMTNGSSPAGQFALGESKKYAAKNGFTVVSGEGYEASTTDFSPILLRVLAAKPDLIDLTSTAPETTATIIKQARTMGYTGLIVHWSGVNLQVVMKITGAQAAENVISGMEIVEPYPAAVQALADKYRAKYSEPIDAFTIEYYAAHETLLQAIAQANSLDNSKIADALRGHQFDTILGKISFGGKDFYGIDNQLLMRNPLAQVKGGKEEQITWLDPAPY